MTEHPEGSVRATGTVLDSIIEGVREDLEARRAAVPLEEIRRAAAQAPAPRDAIAALRGSHEDTLEIIAEVKSCNLDEARRLTDRTIIPVLKGVSREVAEFHLEKFKRVKIAGRVTTRQRG